MSEKMEVRYVVIDEAQDFSLFQFYALKAILNTERFTILGDLSQGIHSYKAIKDWESVLEGVFVKDKSTFLTLEQSYRTTIEIMEVANKVISLWPSEGLLLAKPVVRHGEVPELLPCDSKDFLLKAIERKLAQFKKEEFKSIALIGKTLKECQKIHKALQQNKVTGIALLDGKDDSYHHEVVIVPSYLAKGLEFDAVMIISYEEQFGEDELDVKLLYVAMTRALHRVSIFYLPETQGILKHLN
ncbi:MAG: ATP-binding domain-containing protein [Vallitaleaceae bacterium]|nr:ATP-binding domain-containing protein [Vallitaleaceae bacterium]